VAQKFVTPITIKNLASSGSDALTVFLNGEAYGRVKLEAGGRISWSNGEGGYDTNIYRDSANVLATDDVLKATAGIITMAVAGAPTAALADGALAVDTTNNTFYFRANGAWSEISGNSTITVSDTAPADAEVGALWFDSTSLEMFIYYGSAWVQLNADTGAEELSDLFDIEFNNLIAGEILKYDGEKWVNETGPSITVSDTAPTGSFAGDLWYDSTSLEMFIYYGGNWVEVNAETGAEELSDLFDIEFANLASGQVLKYNGEKWVNDTDNAGTTISSIDDINDVTITSAASGQFLKWNGTAWVNDAIDLGTDTTGNYMSAVTAGTGISVTHTPGEGSSAAIGLNATLDNLSDVTITSAANGQVLQWNGTAWVNAAAASGGATVNVSETAPASPSAGDLWFESDTAKTFIYYDSQWIEVGPQPGGGAQVLTTKGDLLSRDASNFARLAVGTNGYFLKADSSATTGLTWSAVPTINNLDDIGDVTITSVSSGQVLKWNGTAWANAADDAGTTISSIDDINDVTITSATSGQFLKWNGTAWVNDAIDLATDTTGSFVQSLVAGTGVTLANNSGENATPTITVDTSVIQARVTNVTDTEIGYLDGVTSAIQTQIDTKAPIASPTFTGTVSGITATMVGLGSVNNTADTAKPVSTAQQTALDLKANLASPALTGTPTAPTAALATNTTQVATTAFVRAEVAALVGTAGATLDTLGELSDALGDDANFAATTATAIGLKAPLASPTFTGTVTVPTPSNNTDASTKAYVDAAQSAAQVYADSLTYSISDLTDGVTANAAELNVLDGITASTAELNILDGVTSSTAELNILDGATLSTTELNYVDGVTSAIQTQLNAKAPLASPALTGTPTAPTASAGTNTTQVATTAFVVDAVNTATAANTVELGTDTTGNYMVNVSAGTGISVTHTQSEGSTATVAINATLDNLSDVSVASPTTGQFLKWDGSAWVASNVGASVSSTAPTSPTQGQIWFYQDTAQTFVYYGTAWIEIGGSNGSARVQVSSSAPASPLEGDLWFDSDTAQTFAYYDSQWVEIGTGSVSSVSISSSPPASPAEGNMWFDSDTAQTFTYYDSQWVELGASGMAATISDTAPASPIAGQVWFNSSSGATFVYYGGVWVEVGVAPFDQLLSTLDAKGDLLVGTADNTVAKLAVGSASQVLAVDSSTATGLTWSTPATEDYYITNSGSGAYLINGVSNGTIHFKKGKKYKIVVNATGHPFWIQTVSGGYSSGNVYSTGITNGGTQNGTIIVELPQNAPDTLYYACQYHSSMAGSISTLSIEPDVKTELNTKASTGKSIAMAIVFGG